MRVNLEDNVARRIRLLSPTHEMVDTTLIGTFVIPDDGPMFLFLNGGVADRLVFLPDIPPQGGLMYIVANVGATNNLNVVDSDGLAIATVGVGQVGIFICSQLEWVAFSSLGGVGAALVDSLLDEPRVVAADFVVGNADTTIAVQKAAPAATAGTLPTVASRNGRPVSVVDWSTAVVDHTITLTPNGTETIMRQSTWTINSNAANLASVTLWPSVALNGWYIKP